MYHTVIFDLDGTLLNTIDDLTDAVNYCMRKYRFSEYSVEEIKTFVGNGIRRLMQCAVPGGETNHQFEEIFQTFRTYYTEHCQRKTGPYMGILELLECLKKENIKLAIVSNKNQEAVQQLNHVYFEQYISVAIGDSKEVRRKPYPDSVNLVMEKLNTEQKGVLYVGDSEVDKQTADNVGVDCALVSWGFRNRSQLELLHPQVIVDTPQQLLRFIHSADKLSL